MSVMTPGTTPGIGPDHSLSRECCRSAGPAVVWTTPGRGLDDSRMSVASVVFAHGHITSRTVCRVSVRRTPRPLLGAWSFEDSVGGPRTRTAMCTKMIPCAWLDDAGLLPAARNNSRLERRSLPPGARLRALEVCL